MQIFQSKALDVVTLQINFNIQLKEITTHFLKIFQNPQQGRIFSNYFYKISYSGNPESDKDAIC